MVYGKTLLDKKANTVIRVWTDFDKTFEDIVLERVEASRMNAWAEFGDRNAR